MSIAAEESTRLRPLVALQALRALFRNGEDTKQVFIIADALRGRTGLTAFERFRRTALGRDVLAGKRSLLDVLNDRPRLAALPDGALGRRYYDFMAEENLTADGLVDASRAAGGDQTSRELRLFRERNRDQHDLQHVTTGYGRDPLGEVCLLAFGYAQNGNRGIGFIAFMGMLKIARALPGQPVISAVRQAYRNGKAAARLFEQDWEALLPESLDAVRRSLGIAEPTVYQGVIEAARSGKVALRMPRPTAMAAE
jgi:ubiquinone biosynthesis protein COQ4